MDVNIEPAHRATGPPGTLSPTPVPILVGRARERLFLREELAAAIGGRGRLVLLGGEAGIGKSTLAHDLAREAEDAGLRFVSGHCYDLTNTPPYGPWLDLFRGNRNDPHWPVPPKAFREGHFGRVTDQSALYAEVRRYIVDLAAIRPLYLLLEDLHWADPASIELLRHVAPSLKEVPILLLATYRHDELTRHNALFQHLPALVREADASRLEPHGLDESAIRALVAAYYRLGDSDEARLAVYVERHADGNPFFAVELLRALEEEGLVRPGVQRSSLGELARVIVPALLRQVIEGRVSRLGEETRHLLEIAAVIGQEVPLELWAALADLEMEQLLAIVEPLVESHLIEAMRNGTHVRFVHALTRETIYQGILPPRRRLWHLRVGEAFAAVPGVDPDAVAVHFQQAGDSRAWRWFEQASVRAQRIYAWVTAADRLRTAASLLEGVDGEERTYTHLVFRLSYLLRFSDTNSSIIALDEVGRIAAREGDTLQQAELRLVRGIHLCYLDRFRSGLAEMQNGLAVLEPAKLEAARASSAIRLWFTEATSATTEVDLTKDEPLVTRLNDAGFDFRRCVYLWFCASAGRPEVENSDRFISLFEDVSSSRGGVRIAVAFALHGLGIAYAALGKPVDAHHVWAQSREIFEEVDHFALIAFVLLGELRDVALTYSAGKPATRRRLAAEAETALAKAGGALRPGMSARLAWLGCFVLDGRWEEADELLRELPEPGNAYLRREITATTALLARYRGDYDRAWEQIYRMLPNGPETEPGNVIHQEGLFLQHLAVDLCLDAGDLSSAREWLEANDRWLTWSGSVLGRAGSRLSRARWHHAAGESERAVLLAIEALGLASDPDQPLVRLAAERLIGEIDTADREYAAAEAHLARAFELAGVCETPFERALTLLALAELRLTKDGPDAALPQLDEVCSLCVRLRAAPVLARAETLMASLADRKSETVNTARLTPREIEVLRFIARHRTDKEIAEALFISPYTASTHVKHVLTKLNTASRREAATYAVEHGIV